MRLMITDSGLGGLSVCAGLEKALGNRAHDLEILFVNANPHAAGGYNSLASQNERIAMFDRFLRGSYACYYPDRIAIACNTLSVIYDETDFSKTSPIPVDGIVQAAVNMSQAHLLENPNQELIIFATETTTEAGTYPQLIHSEHAQVVSQACPNLASAITRDATGQACVNLLESYANEAFNQIQKSSNEVGVLLACTHYGYQSKSFKKVLEDRGVIPHILDPNASMVEQLLRAIPVVDNTAGNLQIRFISRFPIPDYEIESLSIYLQNEAPLTLQALTDQEVNPELFAPR